MKVYTRLIATGLILVLLLGILSACGEQELEKAENPVVTSPTINRPTIVQEPHSFELIQGEIHEIITITNVTNEKISSVQKVECDTIYSSDPNRPGYGTVYFKKSKISGIKEGQTYLVNITRHSEVTAYAAGPMLLLIDGVFHFDWPESNNDFYAISSMNSIVESYLMQPDDRIPSLPQEPLQGDVTIEGVIIFLENMEKAYIQWKRTLTC